MLLNGNSCSSWHGGDKNVNPNPGFVHRISPLMCDFPFCETDWGYNTWVHDLGAFKLTGWQAGSEGSSQHTLRVGLEHCNRLQSIAGRDRDSGIEIISLRRTSNLAKKSLCRRRDGLRPTPGLDSPAAVAERSVLSCCSCMGSVTLRRSWSRVGL